MLSGDNGTILLFALFLIDETVVSFLITDGRRSDSDGILVRVLEERKIGVKIDILREVSENEFERRTSSSSSS